MEGAKLIVTHDNNFHMDDVIACFMLSTIYPKSTIIRTRDQATIDRGDYVVDVGGVYNPATHRYDHHQRECTETYNSAYTIKLSSAGMVFKHHAREFLAALGLQSRAKEHNSLLISRLYHEYFLAVDANDNGVDASDNPKYLERTLDDIVASLNPLSYPPGTSFEGQESARMERFTMAMEIMGADLVRFCEKLHKEIERCYSILITPFIEATSNYIVLQKSCRFSTMLQILNDLYNKQVYICIYPRASNAGVIYSILCIPKANLKYTPEAPLLEAWRGCREDKLHAYPGLEDALFVHASGFCGAAKTLSCAITMVEESIREYHRAKE
ncbi:hypothetical protein NEDG_00369 [Nematocida displodere]|uniref:Metal-dependent protein hydrolase n=1 Tax=Nematocida displodere TaxID=1805483 RepID=A0A177EIU5_9MICR|nr:hypothetical protein NEDG_00369 [Nematocida displodere]